MIKEANSGCGNIQSLMLQQPKSKEIWFKKKKKKNSLITLAWLINPQSILYNIIKTKKKKYYYVTNPITVFFFF